MKTHDWKKTLRNKLQLQVTHSDSALAKSRFIQKAVHQHETPHSQIERKGPWIWLSVPVMALGVIFFFQTIQFQPLTTQKISHAQYGQILQTQAEIDEIITTSYLEGFDEGANIDEEIGE